MIRPDRTHLSLWRALGVLLVMAALVATPAAADPGTPGVGNAAQVVYPDVAGEDVGDLNPNATVVPDEVLGDPGDPGGDGGGSLPFTGFPAVLILGIGVGALLLGAVARRHSRS